MGTSHRVAIVGGGIGGMTAAIALAQAGHRATVLERAPELAAVGAGITLQINAMRVLGRLGLGEKLVARGAVIRRGRVASSDGATLSELDFTTLSSELGAPCVGIHRAALQEVLRDALVLGALRLGAEVRSIDANDERVSARLADGTTIEADVLVGADGLRSMVRETLHGAKEPEYAGYTSWRGVCENAQLAPDDETVETWGPGSRFGVVPIGGGRLYWFAVADAPAGGKDGADRKGELVERFGAWHRPVPAILEATNPAHILRTDISDREPLRSWGRGRVTLLGDAAHPMTPNLGQGAGMAIEDALVLAKTLSETSDAAAGLRRYEDRRRDRTARVVLQARQFGRLGQWSNPLARSLRNLALRASPKSMAVRQLRWLYADVC